MNITQVYKQFPTEESCIRRLEQVRWKGKPICPYCQHTNHSSMKDGLRYHCNNCNTSYSVTVGTIFHKTHVDLQKWFLAMAMIINALKSISVRQLARDIEVNKNTAWYMVMRIRQAMLTNGELLRGIVEILT
jgi:transposase-like protein